MKQTINQMKYKCYAFKGSKQSVLNEKPKTNLKTTI